MIRQTVSKLMGIAFLCCSVSSCIAQDGLPVDVNFCDLLTNSDRYNRKEVEVRRATYKYGYEWSYLLHCLTCADKGRIWLDLPLIPEGPTERALKRLPKGSGTVNLTVRGTFTKCGTCGHARMAITSCLQREASPMLRS